MKPKILKSESDYEHALETVAELMDAAPGSQEEDDLELWSLLVENYESRHYPVPPPDPIEAIKFRMEQLGMKQKDLAPLLSGKNRASEILSHKRKLTLAMVRRLNQNLGIPAEILIQEPERV